MTTPADADDMHASQPLSPASYLHIHTIQDYLSAPSARQGAGRYFKMRCVSLRSMSDDADEREQERRYQQPASYRHVIIGFRIAPRAPIYSPQKEST